MLRQQRSTQSSHPCLFSISTLLDRRRLDKEKTKAIVIKTAEVHKMTQSTLRQLDIYNQYSHSGLACSHRNL